MKPLQFGFVGSNEAVAALEKLKEDKILFEDYNFWMEQPHQGDLVRGYKFKTIYDLDEVNISKYLSINEYLDDRGLDSIEDEDAEHEIIEMLKNGTPAFAISDNNNIEYTDNEEDAKSIAFNMLEDGRGIRIYTYDEMIEALEQEKQNSTIDNELLIKFVLEKL